MNRNEPVGRNVAETKSRQGELISSIHFTFAPEDADKVEAMLSELQDASRKEEGVIAFEVARGVENRNVFALWEAYRDEAAYETHKGTEYFKRLVIDGVRPLARQRNGEIVSPI